MTRGFEKVSDGYKKHPQDIEIQLPQRGTQNSIAYDVYSPIDVVIKPMDKGFIWTDVKAYFKKDEALLINVRSSMGKIPIVMANSQGWVESDYYQNEDNDGNLGINLFNLGKSDYIIKAGDKIAQCMFINYLVADSGNTDTIRTGGFGSTDKK